MNTANIAARVIALARGGASVAVSAAAREIDLQMSPALAPLGHLAVNGAPNDKPKRDYTESEQSQQFHVSRHLVVQNT